MVEEIGTLGGLGGGAVAVDGGASVWLIAEASVWLIADALSGGGDSLKPRGLPRFSRWASGGAFGLRNSRGDAGTVWLIARGGGGAGAVWLITSRGGAGTMWLITRAGGGAGAVLLIADVAAIRWVGAGG